MDSTHLYKYQQQQLFTDLCLNVSDNNNSFEIFVHKIILMLHSPFFEKLLTFGDNPRASTLKINVADAHVAIDLILSFYGQESNHGSYPYWQQQLYLMISRDYFGLKVLKPSFNEKILAEDYDYVLKICEIMGFDEDTIAIMVKNMPEDYDPGVLSDDLQEMMVKADTSYAIDERISNGLYPMAHSPDSTYVAIWFKQNIGIRNIFDKNLVYSVSRSGVNLKSMLISPLNNSIAVRYDAEIYVYYFLENTTKYLRSDEVITSFVYSTSGKYLAFTSANVVNLYLVEPLQLVRTIVINPPKDDLHNIKFSFDDEYIGVGWHYHVSDINFYILSVKTGDIVYSIRKESYTNIFNRELSEDKYIVYENNKGLKIHNIDKGTNKDILLKYHIDNVVISPGNIYLAVSYRNSNLSVPNEIALYEISTGNLFHTFCKKSRIVFSSNNEYVALSFGDRIYLYKFSELDYAHKKFIVDAAFIRAMAFSPDNKYFAFATPAGLTTIYDSETWEQKNEIDASFDKLFKIKSFGPVARKIFSQKKIE